MMLSAGDYELGPGNARLIVTTGRQGVAAKAGHDLVLEVMKWKGTLKIAAQADACSVALSAEATSLDVVGASGGARPLTGKDRAEIRTTIDKHVLKRQAIEFRSTGISPTDGGLMVNGLLRLRGEERPVSFAISSDGSTITSSLRVDQRDWGIKPYSALLGALRVDAYVTVEVQGTVEAPSSASANPVATASAENVDEGMKKRMAGASEDYQEGIRLREAGDVAAADAAFRRGDLAGDAECANEYGVICAQRGDMADAEGAFRRAANGGSPVGWSNLSLVLLDEHGDAPGAIAALERSQELGYVPASFNLGCLLRERGDVAGADRAWSCGAAAGDGDAAFNLGLLRKEGGDADGAIEAWRVGRSLGEVRSTHSLGRALEEAGDVDRAVEAFRDGDERGDADSAFSLGALLYKQGRPAEALEAFSRSADRGKDGVRDLIAQLHRDPELGSDATPQTVTIGQMVESFRAANRPEYVSVPVAPLAEGEERLVQVVHRPDGNRNDIYLIHSRPDDGDVMGTRRAGPLRRADTKHRRHQRRRREHVVQGVHTGRALLRHRARPPESTAAPRLRRVECA
jgi:tetratricopeptide (TPR) repeat protein